MPESIISPQVKTNEIDQSFIPDFPEQVGALVIGTTKKGNHFTSQSISQGNIGAKIGFPNQENLKEYTSLTAYNYLRGGADSVKVMPITALSGETMGNSYTFVATVDGTEYEFLKLFPTADKVGDSLTVTASGTVESLTITVDSEDLISDADFTNEQVVIDFYERFRNPLSNVHPVFVKSISNIYEVATELGEDSSDISSALVDVNESSTAISTVDYQNAVSPWVLSQNGDKLFRVHSLSGSDTSNRDIRIRISNIQKPDELGNDVAYGQFTVEVYNYTSSNLINDDDRSRNQDTTLYESYTVSLNPQSPDYIERRIGNRREYFDTNEGAVQFDGIYANRSNFIRVEVSDGLSSTPSNSLPWGFERYNQEMDFYAGQTPSIYRSPSANLDGGINFNNPFVDFLHVEELSVTNEPASSDENYDLGDFSQLELGLRKFSFGLFGGTKGLPDNKEKKIGLDIETSNTLGLDFTDENSSGYEAYKRALDILSDKEFIQFNVLFLPELNLRQHANIIQYAINIIESRGDAILFVNGGHPNDSVSELKDSASLFDTSFASTFAPWLLSSQNSLIPPVSAFANSLATNDRNYKPWFSLIGIERGRITGVSNVSKRYKLSLRDELVKSNVNPIAKHKGHILIYGSSTLQQRDTLLSKYPIRRLLIEAKRRIADVADFYIGRQYTDQLIESLSDNVSTELADIRDKNGLTSFSVEFDSSPDLRSRGIISGAIVLQPTTGVEGIVFTFKLTNTGVDFDF